MASGMFPGGGGGGNAAAAAVAAAAARGGRRVSAAEAGALLSSSSRDYGGGGATFSFSSPADGERLLLRRSGRRRRGGGGGSGSGGEEDEETSFASTARRRTILGSVLTLGVLLAVACGAVFSGGSTGGSGRSDRGGDGKITELVVESASASATAAATTADDVAVTNPVHDDAAMLGAYNPMDDPRGGQVIVAFQSGGYYSWHATLKLFRMAFPDKAIVLLHWGDAGYAIDNVHVFAGQESDPAGTRRPLTPPRLRPPPQLSQHNQCLTVHTTTFT